MFCINISKSYRDISYEAAITLSKSIPLELDIIIRNLRYCALHNRPTPPVLQAIYSNSFPKIKICNRIRKKYNITIQHIPNVHEIITPPLEDDFFDYETTIEINVNEIKTKKLLFDWALERWQLLWNSSNKAEITRILIPRLAEFYQSTFTPDYHSAQVLTGHGNFRKYLFSINRSPSPTCRCGHSDETPYHIIFECNLPLINSIRNYYTRSFDITVAFPESYYCSPEFDHFCHQIMFYQYDRYNFP